jgi:peptide chain release factor subunit 3
MEHDAHAEAPPPEDATVDDWAREDVEPMPVGVGEATPGTTAAAPEPPSEGERAPPPPLSRLASRGAILRLLRLDLSLVSADLWCWGA